MNKKTKIGLVILLIGIALIAERFILKKDGFEIQLLEKDILVISDENIISYNEASHEIKLTDEGVKKFKTIQETIGLYQESFVIKLNGKKIYSGHFWSDVVATSVTSYSKYSGAVINYDGLYFPLNPKDSNTLYIEILHPDYPGPLSENSEVIDPRNNPKIFDYFQKAGKLVETKI